MPWQARGAGFLSYNIERAGGGFATSGSLLLVLNCFRIRTRHSHRSNHIRHSRHNQNLRRDL